ncbi:MAG: hypothetical protein AAGA99_27380 [Actinomycetota bacterium]
MSIVRGRPWPEPGEELWTDVDRDQAIELRRRHAELCPRCGTNPNHWLDDNGRHLDPPPFEARAIHCFGCDEIDAVYDEIKAENSGKVPPSWRVGLFPNTPDPTDDDEDDEEGGDQQ